MKLVQPGIAGGDARRLVQVDARRRRCHRAFAAPLTGDHRHDRLGGNGDVVVARIAWIRNQVPVMEITAMNQIDQMPPGGAIAPEDPRAVAVRTGLKKPPELLVHHQPGDQRGQHRQAEQRHQVPAPAETVGERHQPPAVQGAGEGLEVEVRGWPWMARCRG
jgi:hypothetical protein